MTRAEAAPHFPGRCRPGLRSDEARSITSPAGRPGPPDRAPSSSDWSGPRAARRRRARSSETVVDVEVALCSFGRFGGRRSPEPQENPVRRLCRPGPQAGSFHVDEVASGSYYDDMRAVGLKILKNRLSEYVRLAASGETVLVTDRDRVVAELVPPQAGRAPAGADALLADAVRQGWLTPPLLPGSGVPPRAPVTSLKVLLEELAQDRVDR